MDGTYIIREVNGGDYWRGDRWTPASNEAKEYDTRAEAQAEGEEKCEARDWAVVAN